MNGADHDSLPPPPAGKTGAGAGNAKPDAFGDTVIEAFQAAVGDRLSTWGDTLSLSG